MCSGHILRQQQATFGVGGFVLVSGNFRTKTSSFCGSQLAGDTGLRHAGRQAWDQHVAEGAGCYRSQAGGLPQTDKGSFPSVKASCSGQGLKQHEEMTESGLTAQQGWHLEGRVTGKPHSTWPRTRGLWARLWRPSRCQTDGERMTRGDLPSSELLGASPLQGTAPDRKDMEAEAGS